MSNVQAQKKLVEQLRMEANIRRKMVRYYFELYSYGSLASINDRDNTRTSRIGGIMTVSSKKLALCKISFPYPFECGGTTKIRGASPTKLISLSNYINIFRKIKARSTCPDPYINIRDRRSSISDRWFLESFQELQINNKLWPLAIGHPIIK